jgi:hypothetical protein
MNDHLSNLRSIVDIGKKEVQSEESEESELEEEEERAGVGEGSARLGGL